MVVVDVREVIVCGYIPVFVLVRAVTDMEVTVVQHILKNGVTQAIVTVLMLSGTIGVRGVVTVGIRNMYTAVFVIVGEAATGGQVSVVTVIARKSRTVTVIVSILAGISGTAGVMRDIVRNTIKELVVVREGTIGGLGVALVENFENGALLVFAIAVLITA